MNGVLVIFLTGMAVLGAYYLAGLLADGFDSPRKDAALLVLPGPLTMAQAIAITAAVREKLPRCEVIACLADAGELPPRAGLRGLRFVGADSLREAAARELDLQTRDREL